MIMQKPLVNVVVVVDTDVMSGKFSVTENGRQGNIPVYLSNLYNLPAKKYHPKMEHLIESSILRS